MPQFHLLYVNRRLVAKLEKIVIVVFLLYFLSVKTPPPLTSTMMNALSYPAIAVLTALHWRRMAYVATRDIFLLLLLGVAFASILWTVDMNQTIDANRGLVRTFLFGVYLATCFNLKQQMRLLVWVFGLALGLSLLSGILGSGISRSGWVGIFLYKNYLARAMCTAAILYLIIAFNYSQKRWLYYFGFTLAVMLCIFARSSSGLVFLLISLSIMPLYTLIKQHYKVRVIFLCFVGILAAIIGILVVANQETILVDILGEGITLNNRTPIWTLVIERVLEERPWLGYGYDAFWTTDAGIHVIQNTWAAEQNVEIGVGSFNAHNSFIELFSYFGFLGLFIYMLALFNVMAKTIVLLFATKRVEFFWVFQFLIIIIMASMIDVGSKFISASTFGILGITSCLSIALEYRSWKQENRKSLAYSTQINQKHGSKKVIQSKFHNS